MASVTLDDLYLHEATDNSVYITAILTGEREQASKPGQVRRYANGRLRSVSSSASPTELSVELRLADRSDVDQVRTWMQAHTLLLYREPRGRRLWGVLFDLTVEEVPGASEDFADVSFTFHQVSYEEAV